MTEAEQKFRVRGLDAYQWPCSYRYHLTGPDGRSQQSLTVDAPGVAENVGASQLLGLELWKRGVAIATSRAMTLLYWETVCWKLGTIASPQLATDAFGLRDGAPAPRELTPQAELVTGHEDPMGFRRFPLYGAPEQWIAGRRLTHAGMNAIEFWGHLMILGLASHMSAAPMRWLLPYPELLPTSPENPPGVAFRLVEYVRVWCQPDRAPEPSSEPWP